MGEFAIPLIVSAIVGAGATAATVAMQPKVPKVNEPKKPKTVDPEQAASRQRQRQAGAFGRSDTVLTGPLGNPAEPLQGQRKTLLGQ